MRPTNSLRAETEPMEFLEPSTRDSSSLESSDEGATVSSFLEEWSWEFVSLGLWPLLVSLCGVLVSDFMWVKYLSAKT